MMSRKPLQERYACMAKYFRGKYKVETTRAQWWDYATSAAYFVTICTAKRIPWFGVVKPSPKSVEESEMCDCGCESTAAVELTSIGEIALNVLKELPAMFPYVTVDESVIMPDHVHVILVLDSALAESLKRQQLMKKVAQPKQYTSHLRGGVCGEKSPMLHDNLSRVVRWYKGRVRFEAASIDTDFRWQERFFDRIVRDNTELCVTKEYILRNPERWLDKEK